MKLFRQSKKGADPAQPCPLRHIAFIMDGNGRWAKKRGMPREFGHKEGAKAFQRVVEYCGQIGVEYVTVYAFSTENWKRPANEVNAIMQLFTEYMSQAFRVFAEKGLRIRFIGNREPFSPELIAEMEKLEQDSMGNPKVLNVAFNYGGREEIVQAARRVQSEGRELTEESLGGALYTDGCPDPDLIVRTGGEMRISNFLLWQAAYAELYFTDTLWPDMREKDVDAAVEAFRNRNRRYGGV